MTSDSSDDSVGEEQQPRPRASGWLEPPDERNTPLMVALGRLVLAAAVLEKTLHLELARVHYERAQASADPPDYGLEAILLETEQLTSGKARSQLEALGLPAELNARIRDAVGRRNALLHRPLEDADLVRAIATGEGLEGEVKRIERLAIDCGELSVELERFAGDQLAAMLGMSREQIAQLLATLDPSTIPNPRTRAQLEALKASGLDLSQHANPPAE